MAVSLGVGASTLAILNFFAAIRDGHIDETERNMMGIVYKVLRFVMYALFVIALLRMIVLYIARADVFASVNGLFWIIIFVLFLNAYLMTIHVMPSTFGPAIQAGSWYTLGLVSALLTIRATELPLLAFLFIYIAMVAMAVVIVNGAMAYLKTHLQTPPS